MAEPLTQDEIQDFATKWFKKLDVHAPIVEILPMLVDEGLEMKFPEATLAGQSEFEDWYQGVVRIFFDEVHTLKVCEATIDPDRAVVKIVVRWETSRWNPPAANSDRIILDAYQTWVLVRHPETGKPVVKNYIVDEFEYAENSARL